MLPVIGLLIGMTWTNIFAVTPSIPRIELCICWKIELLDTLQYIHNRKPIPNALHEKFQRYCNFVLYSNFY